MSGAKLGFDTRILNALPPCLRDIYRHTLVRAQTTLLRRCIFRGCCEFDTPNAMGRDSTGGFHPFGGRVSKQFGDRLNSDDPYLSYYDVRLTRGDVSTMRDGWMTDNCISFWEEYLEHEFLARSPGAHIILLRPSMSFMLTQTPDPLTLASALPSFNRVSHIFLPINDCSNPQMPEGGSHWSLLLVSVRDNVAFHYDSLNPSNCTEAANATHKLSILLKRELRFQDLRDSPQQSGVSDCGVFVCIQMRHLLLKKLLTAGSQEQVNLSMGGKMIVAAQGRKEMLKIVEERRKEGEQRQSRSSSPFTSPSKSPPRIDH